MILSAFRSLQDWVARDARPGIMPWWHWPQLGRERAPSRRAELRRLPAGAVVGFAVEEQARVTCLGGELWVTGPGTGDRVLATGQSLSVVGSGRVVAEALRDARFVVTR